MKKNLVPDVINYSFDEFLALVDRLLNRAFNVGDIVLVRNRMAVVTGYSQNYNLVYVSDDAYDVQLQALHLGYSIVGTYNEINPLSLSEEDKADICRLWPGLCPTRRIIINK